MITQRDIQEDPIIASLYSPSKRQVGCVILNAAVGIADRRVNNIWPAEDWFVAPVDDMFVIQDKLSIWKLLAELPRDQRPGPEHFAAVKATAEALGIVPGPPLG